VVLIYQDTNSDAQFATHFKYYPSDSDVIVFEQTYPNGANNTADPDQNGDGVISSFPSFKVATVDSTMSLGFAHFGGFMASAENPQFGAWSSAGSSNLRGGITETGPLAIFDAAFNNTVVISPLTDHMAINDGVDSSSGSTEFRLGLLGNITQVPVKEGFSFILTLTRNGGGVNAAMSEWGERQLQYHGQRRRGNSHDRDYTLQYLGYSTDNGAYYYYYTEPHKNYQETMIDVKAYHDSVGLPTKWVLLDSWWYYKGANGGVKNWTARPDIFPNGTQYVHEQTKWQIQAHNRYWSTDNDYRSMYTFNCSSVDCLPEQYSFWEYLFDINEDWGLTVYEQDWLSKSEDSVPAVQTDANFGRAWLMQMGQSAYQHDLSIQYCMSYPRHVMTSVELASVTQARASDDYHPGNDQWRIGISSIFNWAIDIAPSKDSFWSMPGAQPGPYSTDTQEPYNRLQALVLSLSNGPYAFSDQIGKSDVALIMRCCNADGLVLRPDEPAMEIDKYFLNAAGLDTSGNVLSGGGEVWSTTSVIGNSEYLRYYYVFSVNLKASFKLYPSYIARSEGGRTQAVDNWIAFETNSTSSYKLFNETSPLTLDVSNKYTFEYYTFIPLLSTDTDGYYLQGEVNKWISVSGHRFKEIIYEDSGEVYVRMQGAVGETVDVAFVKYPDMTQTIVSCKVGETQQLVIRMPSQTCTPY